jgi:hypothetical protein
VAVLRRKHAASAGKDIRIEFSLDKPGGFFYYFNT